MKLMSGDQLKKIIRKKGALSLKNRINENLSGKNGVTALKTG
jgi:hypothetical protein